MSIFTSSCLYQNCILYSLLKGVNFITCNRRISLTNRQSKFPRPMPHLRPSFHQIVKVAEIIMMKMELQRNRRNLGWLWKAVVTEHKVKSQRRMRKALARLRLWGHGILIGKRTKTKNRWCKCKWFKVLILIMIFRARDEYYGTTYSDEEETNSKSHIVRFNGYTYNELLKKNKCKFYSQFLFLFHDFWVFENFSICVNLLYIDLNIYQLACKPRLFYDSQMDKRMKDEEGSFASDDVAAQLYPFNRFSSMERRIKNPN